MPGAPFMALAADFCGGNDAFTKILLHMDGANAGTTFTESALGGAAHTWTASTATTSTTQAKFGATSESTGASAGFITTPDSVDFTLGSGDFTYDCWFWVAGGAGTRRFMFGQSDSSGTAVNLNVFFELNASNVLSATVGVGSVTTVVLGVTAITTTGWHHVAFVRTGNNLKLFLDGVQEGSTTAFSSTINDSPNKFSVGTVGEFPSLFWNGFIDEFRLSVGIARWTANFAPPAAPYF
jgi:hypothetical protein